MKTAGIVERAGRPDFVAIRNACGVCAPLGACLAFRGLEGCVPLVHGSQGCATYMRRYLISHFREPVDVASSSFTEATAIFGGGENLKTALDNVARQYEPRAIGIATSCLAETIGDDVGLYLEQYRRKRVGRSLPEIIHASTPAYAGTQAEGFAAATRAMVARLAEGGAVSDSVNLLPGMISPADLRYLAEIMSDVGLAVTLFPDYSDTLDGASWSEYERVPEGGTPLASVRGMGRSRATIELTHGGAETAGALLETRFRVPRVRLDAPIGVRASDAFFDNLVRLAGGEVAGRHRRERGRLVDALIDGHKYVSGKRALIVADHDLLVGLSTFLDEIGMAPVLCASAARTPALAEALQAAARHSREPVQLMADSDFESVFEAAQPLAPDLVLGSSKAHTVARRLGVPLVRLGFPIHDRFGGQRLLHLGYRGAQQMYDRIVNALLERQQESSPVGFSYQ